MTNKNITSPTMTMVKAAKTPNLHSPTTAASRPFRQRNLKSPHYTPSTRKGYGKSRPGNWKGWAATSLSGSGSGGSITCIKVVGIISSNIRIIQNLLSYVDANITADMLARWSDINAGVLPEDEEPDAKLRTEDEVLDDAAEEMRVIDEKYEQEIGDARLRAEAQRDEHEEQATYWRSLPADTQQKRASNLRKAYSFDAKARKVIEDFEEEKAELINQLKNEKSERREELQAERQKEVDDYETAINEQVKRLEQTMEGEIQTACNDAFHVNDDTYVIQSIQLS